MGRFETAAEFYRFREPYPPEFFKRVAERLRLTDQTHMLDVACGPGNLAIGFAPFVGASLGVDIEPEMLRVARERAGDAAVEFKQAAIEDLDAQPNSFDFVTVGRALHWLPREATLHVFERVVSKDGHVVVCHTTASDARCNCWTEKFREVRRAWSGHTDENFYRPDLDEWFSRSSFRNVDVIQAESRHELSVDDLIGRGLSFSITSPSVLGPRRQEFEAALRTALEPFAHHGTIEEVVVAKAVVFARRHNLL